MKHLLFALLAGTLLVLAGAGPALADDASVLEVDADAREAYWTPATATIRERMRHPPRRLRSGRVEMRTMATEVEVEYVIDAEGQVRDARVLGAEPEGADTRWALQAAQAYTYEPTPANADRTPIRTTTTLTLGPPPASAN